MPVMTICKNYLANKTFQTLVSLSDTTECLIECNVLMGFETHINAIYPLSLSYGVDRSGQAVRAVIVSS